MLADIIALQTTATISQGPVDIPWIDDAVRLLPSYLQWTLFSLMILFGVSIEGFTNTRFFWPCLSDIMKITQALWMIALYWTAYQETETSRFVIMTIVYMTHIVDVWQAKDCLETKSQSIPQHWEM